MVNTTQYFSCMVNYFTLSYFISHLKREVFFIEVANSPISFLPFSSFSIKLLYSLLKDARSLNNDLIFSLNDEFFDSSLLRRRDA